MLLSILNLTGSEGGSEEEASRNALAFSESLQAELDATTDDSARARLLFELAVHEESRGHLESARAHYLAAAEANHEFLEPIERLLALNERGGDSKDLRPLLERLLASAHRPDEQQRAVIARARALSDQQHDSLGARVLLDQWLAKHPDDSAAWLMLEAVAARLGDRQLRAQAISERAGRTSHPLLRSLLFFHLSQIQTDDQDRAAAKVSLEATLQMRGETTHLALIALERLCRGSDDAGFVAALDARARLLATALEVPADAEGLGVPPSERSKEASATASALAAQVHFEQGAHELSERLLEHALSLLPNDSLLQMLRQRVAQARGDHSAVAHWAKQRLRSQPGSRVAAALWVTVADAEAVSSNWTEAISALQQALACDKECSVARAKLLDLLAVQGSVEQLASAIEDCATVETSKEGKAFHHFAAAELLVRKVGHLSAAQEVMARAQAAGASPLQTGRVARFLAALVGDRSGIEQSSSDLRQSVTEESELRCLCLQVMRTRLLGANRPGTLDALAQLGDLPSGQDLANVVKAYSPSPLSSDTASSAVPALMALASRQSDPGVKRALRIAAARRVHSDSAEQAISILRALQQEHPADGLIAHYLSDLLRQSGDRLAGVQALTIAATATHDAFESASTHLEAGLLAWHAGDRRAACASFEHAQERGGDFPASVVSWSRGAGGAGLPGGVGGADPDEQADAFCQLQQFASRACSEQDPSDARESLDSFVHSLQPSVGSPSVGPENLRTAGMLALALWPADQGSTQELDAVESHCSSHGALTSAAQYLDLTARNAPISERVMAARQWATAERSLAAACEWLALEHHSADPFAESQALLHLSELLPEEQATPLIETADLLAWLVGKTSRSSADFFGEHALPGSPAGERAQALEAIHNVYPHDASFSNGLIGYNHLDAGQLAAATRCFRAATDIDAHDVSAWEGLREVALRSENAELMAEALAALGDLATDRSLSRQLWERSSEILLSTLGDEERGILALVRAFEIDPSSTQNYDHLTDLVRQKKDHRTLVRLIDTRLAATHEPAQQSSLYWDKARALRRLGELDGSLAALEQLTALEADHVGALALAGEIHLTRGNFPLACEKLSALSQHPAAPARQRIISGLCAADIASTQLADRDRALELLVQLCSANPTDSAVRERLVHLAAESERWELCARHLQELMLTRADAEGRIAAARLAIAIQRDRLDNVTAALPAVEALLCEAPADGEALDLLLSRVLPAPENEALMQQGRAALVKHLQHNAEDLESALRLAALGDALADAPLQQSALSLALALGDAQPEVAMTLASLGARSRSTPNVTLSELQIATLLDPLDRGPAAELCQLLAPSFAARMGPTLEQLQVGKKAVPLTRTATASELWAWAAAFDINNLLVFAGGTTQESATATFSDTNPAFVTHSSLRAPLSLDRMQAIARQVFALKRGTVLLCHQTPEQVAVHLAGIAHSAGVTLKQFGSAAVAAAGPSGLLQKLYNDLPRKLRKKVDQVCQQMASDGQDPLVWAAAAQRSLDRVALLATGDVSWVQSSWVQGAMPAAARSALPDDEQLRQRRRALVGFLLSNEFQGLRTQLGMAPQ